MSPVRSWVGRLLHYFGCEGGWARPQDTAEHRGTASACMRHHRPCPPRLPCPALLPWQDTLTRVCGSWASRAEGRPACGLWASGGVHVRRSVSIACRSTAGAWAGACVQAPCHSCRHSRGWSSHAGQCRRRAAMCTRRACKGEPAAADAPRPQPPLAHSSRLPAGGQRASSPTDPPAAHSFARCQTCRPVQGAAQAPRRRKLPPLAHKRPLAPDAGAAAPWRSAVGPGGAGCWWGCSCWQQRSRRRQRRRKTGKTNVKQQNVRSPCLRHAPVEALSSLHDSAGGSSFEGLQWPPTTACAAATAAHRPCTLQAGPRGHAVSASWLMSHARRTPSLCTLQAPRLASSARATSALR